MKKNAERFASLGILMVPMPKIVTGSKKPRTRSTTQPERERALLAKAPKSEFPPDQANMRAEIARITAEQRAIFQDSIYGIYIERTRVTAAELRQYAQSVINVRLARERHERGEPSSSFVGVTYTKLKDKGGKWKAQICIDGKMKHLGTFTFEDEAAKAYDEALVAQGAIRVNFPSAQEKAEQDDTDAQLRANEKTARERQERGEQASSFAGVTYKKLNDKGGKWRAHIWVDGKKKSLGTFTFEDEAAKAYDEALVAQGKSRVNFPNAQEKAEQDDTDAPLRANEKTARERHERGEPSSSFVGATYKKLNDKGGKWQADILVDGKKKSLGTFIFEDEAAKAYDEALVAQGAIRVNFPSAQEKAEQTVEHHKADEEMN